MNGIVWCYIAPHVIIIGTCAWEYCITLRLVLNGGPLLNDFQFGNCYYRQTKDTSLGSPISGLIVETSFARPLNLAAMSDLRSGVLSQKWKCCTIRGFWSSSWNSISSRNNGGRNGQREGFFVRQCVFEDLQRCANSRWMTGGSDHNRNNKSSMWPDNILTILCYYLAALHTMKVS